MIFKLENFNKGISLLELTIVMGILSVMVFGTISLTMRNSDEEQLIRAASALQADMRYMQNRAIHYGLRHRIQLDLSNNSYIFSYEYSPNNWEQIKIENIHGTVLLESSDFSSHNIIYTTRGTISQAGSIYLRSGKYQLQITTTVGAGGINIHPITYLGD